MADFVPDSETLAGILTDCRIYRDDPFRSILSSHQGAVEPIRGDFAYTQPDLRGDEGQVWDTVGREALGEQIGEPFNGVHPHPPPSNPF